VSAGEETQSAGQAAPESAGTMAGEALCLTLPLEGLELSALKLLHEKLWEKPKEHPVSKTALLLVMAAMAHYDVLRALLVKDSEYVKQEGFASSREYYQQIITRRGMAEIAQER
jgi:hypothetical protein